jgi:hypothetical protein
MANEPGWHPDPFGRYQRRFHDGERWTEHVATDAHQMVDPLGASTGIPFATPPTALDGGAAVAGQASTDRGNVWRWLDTLGLEGRERPAPRLHAALAGAGGVVLAAGVTTLVVGDDGGRGRAALAGLVVIIVAFAARLWRGANEEMRAGAVGAVASGIAVLGFALFDSGEYTSTGPYLVIALMYLAAWALPGFRGRPVLLGLGLLAIVVGVGVGRINDQLLGFAGVDDAAGDLAVVFLLGAAALLALVWLLDRRGYRGVATPIVVSALICALIGLVAAAVRFDEEGSAFLLTIVGFIVCAVGHLGARRATTWYGAFLTAAGVTTLLAAIVEPTSTTGAGITLLAAAALLLATPVVVKAIQVARIDPMPPPNAPPSA